jgi:hypothetical protein
MLASSNIGERDAQAKNNFAFHRRGKHNDLAVGDDVVVLVGGRPLEIALAGVRP